MRREITVRMEDVVPTPTKDGQTYLLMGPADEGHWVHILDLPPGYFSEAHFHNQDQFQIVIAGSMDMAGEILPQGSIHYTDAGTSYGPFTAGPDGLKLMVLRPGARTKATRTPTRTLIDKIRVAQKRLGENDSSAGTELEMS